MIRFIPVFKVGLAGRVALLALILLLSSSVFALAQSSPSPDSHSFFIDCSAAVAGDGSLAHPWNSLSLAEAHAFLAGDRIAFARGTVCKGSFSPQGSGSPGQPIRLTAMAGDRDHALLLQPGLGKLCCSSIRSTGRLTRSTYPAAVPTGSMSLETGVSCTISISRISSFTMCTAAC